VLIDIRRRNFEDHTYFSRHKEIIPISELCQGDASRYGPHIEQGHCTEVL
jgi:hypothetical protein